MSHEKETSRRQSAALLFASVAAATAAVLTGNTIGGVTFVAAINHAQAVGGEN